MIEFWAAMGLACVNEDYAHGLECGCRRFSPPKPYGELDGFKNFIRKNGLRLSRWEIKEFERLLKKDIEEHVLPIRAAFKETGYDIAFEEDDGFVFSHRGDLEMCAVIGLALNDTRFAAEVFAPFSDDTTDDEKPGELGTRLQTDDLRFHLEVGGQPSERYDVLVSLAEADLLTCFLAVEGAGWSPPSQQLGSSVFLAQTNCASGAVDGRYLHIHQPEVEGFMLSQPEGWKLFQELMATGLIT
jgi:hypothetical protein